jgi:pilus assembly protein CpaF
VHPRILPSADDLIASGVLTPPAAALLKALVASPHGVVIAGEPESGKTTLLSVLSHWLSQPERAAAVERAGELRLPTGLERLMPRWPVGESPRVTFGQTISRALALKPDCLLLDEVRADEPEAIAALLTEAEAPRQIWSFRGAIFAKRLQSALGMLARRADASRGDTLARALFERLPFVITLNRAGGRVRVWAVSEWQFNDSDAPDYTPLLTTEEGHLRLTGNRPVHTLPLPDSFWA